MSYILTSSRPITYIQETTAALAINVIKNDIPTHLAINGIIEDLQSVVTSGRAKRAQTLLASHFFTNAVAIFYFQTTAPWEVVDMPKDPNLITLYVDMQQFNIVGGQFSHFTESNVFSDNL